MKTNYCVWQVLFGVHVLACSFSAAWRLSKNEKSMNIYAFLCIPLAGDYVLKTRLLINTWLQPGDLATRLFFP